MTIENSGSTLIVTFRRPLSENIYAGIALFVFVEMLVLVVLTHAAPRETVFTCDRAADRCDTTGHDIFGGESALRFSATSMTTSRIETSAKGGDLMWVVDRKSLPKYQIAPATGREAQQKVQQAYATDLQRFIDDPKQPRFEARFNR